MYYSVFVWNNFLETETMYIHILQEMMNVRMFFVGQT